jgi:hypothetical protein
MVSSDQNATAADVVRKKAVGGVMIAGRSFT